MSALHAPCLTFDAPSALAPLLRITRLTARFAPDGRVGADVALAARMRGAFGHRLAHDAAHEDEAAQAWRVLFAEKTAREIRGHTPAPFTVAADVAADGAVVATLSLFGWADRWRKPAFDAFIAALSEPPGLSLRAPGTRNTDLCAPLTLKFANWTRQEGIDLPTPSNRLRLSFATPVQFGPADRLSQRFDDLIVGLAQRVSLLAPRFGCSWQADLSAWRDLANRTHFDGSDLRPTQFKLWTSQGGARTRQGWSGSLLVADPTAELRALLAIGAQLGCGRDAAKGFGRYALYPEA